VRDTTASVTEVLEAVADVASALAWPIAAAAIVLIAIMTRRGRAGLEQLTGRVRRLKGPGFELELSVEAATATRDLTEQQFRDFRRLVSAEFDRQATVFAIDEKHQRLVVDHVLPILPLQGDPRPSFRSTIHVPDILFTGALYQLLDYYGYSPGKRGRAFSSRFGIVGRAWRLGEPQVEGQVSTLPEDLVRGWGMTWKEAARAGKGNEAFAAVPLKDEYGVSVGILFFDSYRAYVFGAARKDVNLDQEALVFVEAVTQGATVSGLTSALV
jgi:hypothetical protein